MYWLKYTSVWIELVMSDQMGGSKYLTLSQLRIVSLLREYFQIMILPELKPRLGKLKILLNYLLEKFLIEYTENLPHLAIDFKHPSHPHQCFTSDDFKI